MWGVKFYLRSLNTMAKAKTAKPSKKQAKRPAKPAKRSVKPAKKAATRHSAARPVARPAKAKALAHRSPKPAPKRASESKSLLKKVVTPGRRAAAVKGAKPSSTKQIAKKLVEGKKGAPVGSKIAIGSSGGKNKSIAQPQSKAQPQNKKLVMPTIKENQKEVLPGGGIVQAATRTAPAMRLRADDAEILATAKERYGRKDLDLFRKLIVDQQQEAREEFDILSQNILDTSGEFEADNQNYSLHTAEQGSDAIEREKTFLHAQRTSDYIKKLEEALERIERGTYGICVICGGLIEKERLQAVPITQKHVDCKNKTQVRKVSNGGGFHDVEEQPVNLD